MFVYVQRRVHVPLMAAVNSKNLQLLICNVFPLGQGMLSVLWYSMQHPCSCCGSRISLQVDYDCMQCVMCTTLLLNKITAVRSLVDIFMYEYDE